MLRPFFYVVLLPIVTALLLLPSACAGTPVVVQLRNGDQLTGELIAQETNRIVINTGWAGTVSLPIDIVGGLKTTSGSDLLPAPEPPKPAANVAATTAKKPAPAKPVAAKPDHWKNNIQLGLNINSGAKNQQSLWTRFKSTYLVPYEGQPKKSFRTILDFSADYGETDGSRSANRLGASLKTDFDLGPKSYCYNDARGGYDETRKIDLYYGVGPGVGYHLLRLTAFEMNVEGGVDYQVQERTTGDEPKDIYIRAAEDIAWKFTSKLSLSKKFEFYLNANDPENFRFRLDATASYKLVDNLSLNLTLMDQYDTDPAPKVDQNELQVRSSIGFTF